jgi:hypothetical protein
MGFNNVFGITVVANAKSKSASKVLQLMDKDMSYQQACKKVSEEDNIPIAKLEEELKNYI